MKLELDLHGLREETSAHVERKDKEVVVLQRRLLELQVQFTETQKLGLKKDKVRRGAPWLELPAGHGEARPWQGRVLCPALAVIAWGSPTHAQ